MNSNIKKCLMCPRILDETFYDKGTYNNRYLCSKLCRDIYFDKCFKREIEDNNRLRVYRNKYKNNNLSLTIT